MPAKIRYDDVADGQELAPFEYTVERVQLVMYAGASGDFNPIHWNEGFAKAVGLPDTIATGMHTMGKIGQYITDWCGDPGSVESFKNRFTAPVVVPDPGGASVTVTGTVTEKLDGGRVRLSVVAESPPGTNVSKAEAVVRLS